MQINLQHCRAAVNNIRESLPKNKPYVALLQEPWVNGNKVLGLGGSGNLYYSNVERPRTAILTSRNIAAWFLPQFSNQDCTAVLLKSVVGGRGNPRGNPWGKPLVLASLYMPHESEVLPSSNVINLVNHCESHGLDLIIGTDSNAHNEVWGSTDTNRRGEILLEYLIANNLVISNEGNNPTFLNKRSEQVLDLTLSSERIAQKITNWRVVEEDSFSDHRLITFRICSKPDGAARIISLVKKTNWNKFQGVLATQTKRIATTCPNSVEEIEQLSTRLREALQMSSRLSTPRTIARDGGKSQGWDPSLTDLKRQVRRLHKLSSNSEDDHKRYRDARRRYKKELRKIKREAWRNFCKEVKSMSATAKLHKLISRSKITSNTMIRSPQGTYSETPEEALQLLLNAHFPGNREGRMQRDPFDYKALPMEEGLITSEKVRAAICSFDSYKSPGMDGIMPIHLQKAREIIGEHLTVLFKASLRFGYLPKDWLTAKVVFIPKPGKPTYDVPKSFRPICLTSFMLKTMERIIDWSLKQETFNSIPLNRFQYAYQAGKSTTAALHQLVWRIEKALEQGQYALGLFLDVEGAFSVVPTTSFLEGMDNFTVSPPIYRWVERLLKSREVVASSQGAEKYCQAMGGTPQGGVLSPSLWNMAINSLLTKLQTLHREFHTQMYSDDLQALLVGIDIPTLVNLANQYLDTIDRWCEEHGLSINPGKVEAVIFTLRRKGEHRPLRLRGMEIPIRNKVKCLGVTFDSRLTWNDHVKDRARKATAILMQCRRIVGKNWGLAPKNMCWLYKAVVRPIMAYAAVVWCPSLDKKAQLKALTSVQRLGCLAVSGVMRTTPTIALEALLGLPPVDIFLEEESIRGMLQLRANKEWTSWWGPGRGLVRKSHVKWCEERAKNLPFQSGIPLDHIKSELLFNRKFVVRIPRRSEWIEGDIVPAEPAANSIVVYTDGSRQENLSGLGVFITEECGSHELSLSLGPEPTVYQAEAYAILQAVEMLLDGGHRGKIINIYSDSQACLLSINNVKVTSKLIRDCVSKLNELGVINEVILSWIPGHVGMEGNEKADELARKASAVNFVGPGPVLPVATATQKAIIGGRAVNKFNLRWNNLTTCRQTREAMSRPPGGALSKALLGLERKELREVCSVVTGHCRLNRHLFLLRVVDSPTCQKCRMGKEETPFHYLGECPRYGPQRLNHLGNVTIPVGELWKIPVRDILSFIKHTRRLSEEVNR